MHKELHQCCYGLQSSDLQHDYDLEEFNLNSSGSPGEQPDCIQLLISPRLLAFWRQNLPSLALHGCAELAARDNFATFSVLEQGADCR
jgi:hypothetical protein